MSAFSQEGRCSLSLFGILCIVILLPIKSFGQVTIKEEIEIGSQQPNALHLKSTGVSAGTQSQIDYWQHVYQPQQSGELKIALVKAESFLRPIDTTATFEVSIWGKNGRRDTTVKAQPLFGEPLKGTLHLLDKKDWHIYGNGPFLYKIILTKPEYGKDATIRLLHKYTSETLGYDCSSCCPCRPIIEYTYKGEKTDENLGDFDTIVAAVYDWGKRTGFPEGKYFGIYRSLFHLGTDDFKFPLEGIDSGILKFIGYGGRGDKDEDGYNFLLHEVASSWDEHTVTWATQPEVQGNPFVLQSPPKITYGYYADVYELDITERVKRWIEEPEKNFGFRLSLEEEETEIDYLFVKHLTITGSDNRYSLGSPELDINFSNPSYNPPAYSINAGFVQAGDTVLIAYQNGSTYQQSAYRNRYFTYEIDGKTHTGRRLVFRDSERRDGLSSLTKSFTENMVIFSYVGSKDEAEIMLGETQYYAAVKDQDSGEVSIKEVETDGSGKPKAPENMVTDAFSGNPIEVLSGGKSGVYWERKWAKINNDGTISSGPLDPGFIRLVGRYWEDGKEYKVKLKAGSGTSAELEIKVVKPERLGDKYGKAKDVFDQVVDVDSLVIANAGKYGIPPQLLKAHISGEVYTKDFGGEIGEGFTPGYLYEPFTVEFWLRDKENDYKLTKEWADNIFKVSKESMGSGGAVPKHKHTEKQVYPTTPKTIWDLVSEYSSIEHASPPGEFNSYAKRKNNNTSELVFYDFYTKPKEIYNAIITDVKKKNKRLEGEDVFKKANDSLTVYLKTSWRGGLDSLYVQTRIAASYGYFQVLYTTGILPISSYGANYPKTKIPEKINETEINFQLAMEKYRYLLKEKNVSKWDAGYEKVWFDLLSNWNSKTIYNANIFEKIENYLPLAK